MPASEIAALGESLRRGTSTIAAEVSAARERIARLNPAYRAFSYVAAPEEGVLAILQQELRDDKMRGPLHGVTASIKGCIPVAGMSWTEGSRLYADRSAAADAAIVARLRRAGGIVLGTTTLSELAMYGVTNPFEPMGLNPWAPARTAGGSSTGAGVAAALDLALVNIGTDSGGSIRNPACHCGVVGFMPPIGALSSMGLRNYVPSLGAVGLIGRSVSDVVTAYDTLADGGTSVAATPTRRLAVPRRLIDGMCDAETCAIFVAALEWLSQAGFDLIDYEVPSWLAGDAAAGIISLAECGLVLKRLDLSRTSAGLQRRAEAARRLSDAEVTAARREAAACRGAIDAALAEIDADAFVTPTWPFAAPLIEAETVSVNGKLVLLDPHRNCFVRVANAINGAAMSLPMGLYREAGVPAGLHLLAGAANAGRLLSIAPAIEAALPPLGRPPALATR